MEPLVIKNGKTEFTFFSDKVVVRKKNQTIQEAYHNDIKEIIYNPKIGLKDFLNLIFQVVWVRTPGGYEYLNNTFVIFLKSDREIPIGLSKGDFEKIRPFFKIPIKII